MRSPTFVEVARKDLAIELRTRSTLSFVLLFGVTSVFLFSAAGMSEGEFVPLLLLVFFFSGVLGLSISVLKEYDTGTIEGLKASPISMQDVVAGKMLFNAILVLIIQSVVFPVGYALFDVQGNFTLSFLTMLLANIAISVSVTSISPLASKARARELLMPVLLFPIVFPVLRSSIKAVELALDGKIAAEIDVFIAAYSLTLAMLAFMLAEHFSE